MNERFAVERKRLGYATGNALATALGISHTSVKRIEDGSNVPGGEILASFGRLGADIGFILGGKRSGLIDLQLLGICEAALRAAYSSLRGDLPGPIRSRMTASLYNTVLGNLKPGDDDTSLAMAHASQLLYSLDDPADPDLLSRNLFAATSEAKPKADMVVRGDHNRVAGRDIVGGGKGGRGRKD